MNMNTETFNSARLRYRKPSATDIPAIFDGWASDEEATQWMGWKRHESYEDTREFIRMSDQLWEDHKAGPLLVELLADGSIIGSAGLTYTEPGEVELGYIFTKPFWGRGYASETVLALLDYARRCDFSRVVARAHEDNQASAHILLKHGFVVPDEPLPRGSCPNMGCQDYEQLDYEFVLA